MRLAVDMPGAPGMTSTQVGVRCAGKLGCIVVQVEANRAKLPVALAQLPGGGLGQGVVAYIEDQVQDFNVQVEIIHKVRVIDCVIQKSISSPLYNCQLSPRDMLSGGQILHLSTICTGRQNMAEWLCLLRRTTGMRRRILRASPWAALCLRQLLLMLVRFDVLFSPNPVPRG